ncbi:hypothetical protein FRC08_014185 [Ceratobasidium sp. 394]|nr:hypothetical protein FRC08_014185 [Ceratobasidium sp. 394]
MTSRPTPIAEPEPLPFDSPSSSNLGRTPSPAAKRLEKDLERASIHSNDVPWEASPQRIADVRRRLKQRHIHMFALAGTIGTGLFLSSGKALAEAGPLGAFLGYSIMGVVTAAVAYTASEMSAL